MRRCPITYEPLDDDARGTYSALGLRRLSPRLESLADLEWSAEEQRREARARATKLSIQGIQPKLSALLAVSAGRFEMVDRGGTYILKPQTELFLHVPENEDLTMRLAAVVGIAVPMHGLVRSRDGSWTHFVRRFDRVGRGAKRAVEDFAQLAGASRDAKYDSSMERVAGLLDAHCTFPAVERERLFRRVLFSFVVGNEDMHLKNLSVITEEPVVRLSPAYDLVSSTIALPGASEELALPLHGKKRNLTRRDLLDYFAKERLQLTDAIAEGVLADFRAARESWDRLVAASFLPDELQEQYRVLVQERLGRLQL